MVQIKTGNLQKRESGVRTFFIRNQPRKQEVRKLEKDVGEAAGLWLDARHMAFADDVTDSGLLDAAEKLPLRQRVSYGAMLLAQGMNAFTDNFVKMLIVAFAGVAGKGTDIGGSMQLYLGAIFSLPYILFAPVAGWMSDRFSKQRVFFWMLGVQTLAFGLFLAVLALREATLTLWLCLGCFFLVAAQSAFFSPAKFGILKELVGSRRLGSGSGWLQMLNLTGTLAGMWAGPAWFGMELEKGADAWAAVWWPMVMITVLSVTPMVLGAFVQRTPAHPEVRFRRQVWWEHLANLKLIFQDRPIRLAALGVTYFWFLSNAVGSILVTLSRELHPANEAEAAKALAMMPAMLGVGIMFGSLLAGFICRRRIELGLVPLSGLLLSASLAVVGGFPQVSWLQHGSLVLTGLAGGCFMTPLYAFVQDRAKPEERARVMASLNLMDCIAAVVANLLIVKPMLELGVPSAWQLLVLVPVALAAALYIMKLLPRSFLTLVVSALVRAFYRVQGHHVSRLPAQGSLMLAPNHISYADALMLGVTCPRDVRFVMLESLYRLKWLNWGLKIFGTVPISTGKAKDAIRKVAEALRTGGAVVLFPEGQLTRTGFFNELHKGYELMARLGGEAKVQAVWLDGLWGSVFSYAGGKFFKKIPKKVRYPVSVWFAEPMPAEEATQRRLREALAALSAEAFAHRLGRKGLPRKVSQMAAINALRVLDTALLHGCHTLVCLLPEDHVMAETFGAALPLLHRVKVVRTLEEAHQSGREEGAILIVGDRSSLAQQAAAGGLALRLMAVDEQGAAGDDGTTLPALFDPVSGTLLTLSMPDPPMPRGEEGRQKGRKAGSFGHLLNGLRIRGGDGATPLVVGATEADLAGELTLPGWRMDEEGFIYKHLPNPSLQGATQA